MFVSAALWQRRQKKLRPRQNGRNFPDYIFNSVFLNENVLISIKIPLKFINKGSISNIPALVQIMAWRRPGDNPLSEPMVITLLTHICVTRPQWVKYTHKCTLSVCHDATHLHVSMLCQVLTKTYGDHFTWLVRPAWKWTYCGLVTPYCVKDLCQLWLMQWLVAWRNQTITWTNIDLSSNVF